jgi:hypothetical protein
MPDRAGQCVVLDRDCGAGTILPEHGQRVPHVVCGQGPCDELANIREPSDSSRVCLSG